MPRKNVLFIVVDDLRPQLGCYGMDWIHSPNIDALAAESLVFERAYCQQAVCAPSRCSVLSGCRPDTTGIYDLQTPLRKNMPEVLSLPEHFRNHGYETVSIGKVYHHPRDDLQGWSVPPFQSTGDWKGRGYLTDEALEASKVRDREMIERGDSRRGLGPAFEAADVRDEDYHDGADTQAAIAELKRLAGLDRPFFLGMGFHKPHLPFNAPKRYWDMYDPEKLPLADNPFAPEGATEFSLVDFGELRGYFGIPESGDIPEGLARKLIHGYAACVSYLDAQLGKLIAEMKRLDLWNNTAVVFWGDHGWKLGEYGSWCKHSNFEVDTRAPLLARNPGMKAAGQSTRALVEFVDLYPTLCEMCNLKVPEHCEGNSFIKLLDNPDVEVKDVALSQYPRGEDVMGYAMKTNSHRYVEWRQRNTGEILACELYDHQADSQENVNLAQTATVELLTELTARLAKSFNLPDMAGQTKAKVKLVLDFNENERREE